MLTWLRSRGCSVTVTALTPWTMRSSSAACMASLVTRRPRKYFDRHVPSWPPGPGALPCCASRAASRWLSRAAVSGHSLLAASRAVLHSRSSEAASLGCQSCPWAASSLDMESAGGDPPQHGEEVGDAVGHCGGIFRARAQRAVLVGGYVGEEAGEGAEPG